jgi:hypothetical protein
MLPGLAGLVVSASISAHYLDTMPHLPVPSESRIIPRGIHGVTVYQTPEEDRRLNLLEYVSIGVFGVGLVLGLVYLERWGRVTAEESSEEDAYLAHDLE